ncbi:hypothetical protein T439DRAFT_334279 [Meredithblackwellia eburnea MCA 4105]
MLRREICLMSMDFTNNPAAKMETRVDELPFLFDIGSSCSADSTDSHEEVDAAMLITMEDERKQRQDSPLFNSSELPSSVLGQLDVLDHDVFEFATQGPAYEEDEDGQPIIIINSRSDNTANQPTSNSSMSPDLSCGNDFLLAPSSDSETTESTVEFDHHAGIWYERPIVPPALATIQEEQVDKFPTEAKRTGMPAQTDLVTPVWTRTAADGVTQEGLCAQCQPDTRNTKKADWEGWYPTANGYLEHKCQTHGISPDSRSVFLPPLIIRKPEGNVLTLSSTVDCLCLCCGDWVAGGVKFAHDTTASALGDTADFSKWFEHCHLCHPEASRLNWSGVLPVKSIVFSDPITKEHLDLSRLPYPTAGREKKDLPKKDKKDRKARKKRAAPSDTDKKSSSRRPSKRSRTQQSAKAVTTPQESA